MPKKGYKATETHRKKLSEIRKLRPNRYWLGKKRSKEDVEKFRISHLGKKLPDEQKIKIGLAISGEKNYQWGKGNKDGRTRRKYAPRPCPETCEACGTHASEFSKGLFLDHNHKTDLFRGWLCTRCNVALGMVGDDVDKLLLLIRYLQKNESISSKL